MVDFDKAAINIHRECFGTATNQLSISACFFHLQKSILRKIQVISIFPDDYFHIVGSRIKK